jgi:tRNA U34 5-methylaminomethyl-2-thiouridine-forming methyltransferase MnmC
MTLQHVITEDGSSTLFVPELNEHYHSIHGALQESMHIFIKEGFEQLQTFPASIFEVGFGTGLNAFLTCLSSEKEKQSIYYRTIEKYPIGSRFVSLLNYTKTMDPLKGKLFQAIHDAPWDQDIRISNHFVLHKINGDLCSSQLEEGFYDLVYFDAFGPDVQAELWTEQIFRSLHQSMKIGASLVTYSVKGSVRRAMKAVGFSVEKIPGPPGKREMTRAIKTGF